HYEHVHGCEHHDHMVCNKCGKIIEFIDNRIEELQIEVCKKNKFQAEYHRLQIQGLCEDCC
ncbi:MAG: fur 1, partial [Candidatus Brocadiaceae bacterium]|nr:fur 1 [Candidatus Brocadiaceae bacterium]